MNEYRSQREKQIMKTSGIGIGTNVLLAIFKAIIGLASNSVAIILDAINNISDALSSILTIIGTKLAAKPADNA
jgi:Predicted Co/Zn/Cd cation transporters